MVAAEILAGTIEERFLILTHPAMHELIVRKAEDPERWIRGMSRLLARTREPAPPLKGRWRGATRCGIGGA